ncbi:lamin tail domain-containing protein [Candidatus Uhrbacteria bacterium]|nr:lamin tail domain-containing protein [Candidatus Uhrbacteria bacterium]
MRFATAIIDRYNAIAIEKISDDERAWIAWGVEHEGIPVRALHHKEKTWPHDSVQQSAPVYEGVYTWEQGIYDYARGDRERAFETLGHLLRLVIDTHPFALTDSSTNTVNHERGVSWRDVIRFENSADERHLLDETATMIAKFFREAEAAKAQGENNPRALTDMRPLTRSDIPLRIIHRITAFVTDVEERVARTMSVGVRSVGSILNSAFSHTAPIALGGVNAPLSEHTALAQEDSAPSIVTPSQNAGVAHDRRILPLAQSIVMPASENVLPPSPMLKHEVPLLPLENSSSPVLPIVPKIPPEAVPELLPTVPPPAPFIQPLAPPAVDYLGLPIGYVFHSRDTTPPETTITATPATVSNATDATFVFSATEGGKFFCTLDDNTDAECVPPMLYSSLSEGQHLFSVTAEDGSGNRDATAAAFTWEVDRTAPDTLLTQSPSALTKDAAAVFAFTASEAGATFGYALDGSAWQTAVSSLTIPGLADGEHTVTIRASDVAGNVDPTPAVATWTVDTLPPASPTLTSPVTVANYTTIASTVTLTGTREDGATITIDGSGDGITTPTGTTWEKTVALTFGTTTLPLIATDVAGNVSAPLVITLTRTENNAPTAITNLAITTPIITNDRLTLTWTAPADFDLPAQALTYVLRYATTPITDEATWSSATTVASPPAVGVAGAAETFTVTGLTPATTYYFALRTSDGELLSALSNTSSGKTHYGVRITDAHFQGGVSQEYMGITNERSDPQPLEGWTLYDDATTPHTYPFGVFILATDATVTVHTGSGTNTQTDLYWVHSPVWNNDHDKAFLKDSSGMQIDKVEW